ADASSMSWLQPAYALLLFWAPVKAPEWLISLNFVLLLAAQGAIVTYGRTVGYGPLRQIGAALLPLAPGALYPWDGGLQDLRRDIQLVLLCLGILFLAHAYVLQPSWRRGVALGVLVGLAQWSRDNAAAIMLIVAVPPIVLALLRSREVGGIAWLVRIAVIPLLVFLAIAVPYYAVTIQMTIQRYTSSVWGIGESRLESLRAFWMMPASVLLGGDARLGGRLGVAAVTLALMLMAAVAAEVLRRSGIIRIDLRRLREPPQLILLVSGVWVVLAILFYTSVVLGYGARWHAMPFLPMLVGLVAILTGLAGAATHISSQTRAPWLWPLAVGAGCVGLAASAPVRMVLSEPPPIGTDAVAAVRQASIEIAERAQGRPVAFLWSDGFGRHHARYYIAQADQPPLTEYELIAHSNGDPIDLDQPVRPDDRPGELQARLDRTLRRWADFVLVCTDLDRYSDRQAILWPYRLGRPVVEGMLLDPDWLPVAHYTLMGKPFVLLENDTPRPGRPSIRRRATADAPAYPGTGG
ncbi:MAG: hypothetical protein AB7P40_23475, partial [Chloroflexota bacterium]